MRIITAKLICLLVFLLDLNPKLSHGVSANPAPVNPVDGGDEHGGCGICCTGTVDKEKKKYLKRKAKIYKQLKKEARIGSAKPKPGHPPNAKTNLNDYFEIKQYTDENGQVKNVVLGQGDSGIVFEVFPKFEKKEHENGKIKRFALKYKKKSEEAENYIDTFAYETAALLELEGLDVAVQAHAFGTFDFNGRMAAIVLEFIDGTPIRLDGTIVFTKDLRDAILYSGIGALKTIHNRQIVHGDVKADNIMIRKQSTPNGNILAMIDFGRAINLKLSTVGRAIGVGTINLCPLELHTKLPTKIADLEQLLNSGIKMGGLLPWDNIPQVEYGLTEIFSMKSAFTNRIKQTPKGEEIVYDVPDETGVKRQQTLDPALQNCYKTTLAAGYTSNFPPYKDCRAGFRQDRSEKYMKAALVV